MLIKQMNILRFGAIITGLNLCLVSPVLGMDKIILKNKNVFEGRIISNRAGEIVIELKDGQAALTFPRADIAEVFLEKPAGFASAEVFFNKNNYPRAIELFTKIIKEYSNYDWAQKSLAYVARANMKLKKWAMAEKALRDYLKKYPGAKDTVELNISLAMTLTEQGRFDKAAALYNGTLKMKIEEALQARVQYGLAELYLSKEEYEPALMAYLRVLVLFSEQKEVAPGAMLKAGLCYEKLGDIVRARQIYEEIIADYPKTTQAKQAKKRISAWPKIKKRTEPEPDTMVMRKKFKINQSVKA